MPVSLPRQQCEVVTATRIFPARLGDYVISPRDRLLAVAEEIMLERPRTILSFVMMALGVAIIMNPTQAADMAGYAAVRPAIVDAMMALVGVACTFAGAAKFCRIAFLEESQPNWCSAVNTKTNERAMVYRAPVCLTPDSPRFHFKYSVYHP